MTDRELLEQLFNFLVNRNFVQGEEAVVRDMVKRYKQPPLTMYHLVCMQMTMEDYRKLEKLLEQILARFDPNVIAVEEIANIDALKPGNLVRSADGKRLYEVNALPVEETVHDAV